MRNNFLNRVDAERLILKSINGKFAVEKQINGLSKLAIDSWIEINSIKDTSLVELIFKASGLTHSLADVSNEVFNLEEVCSSEAIHSIADEIEMKVKSCSFG